MCSYSIRSKLNTMLSDSAWRLRKECVHADKLHKNKRKESPPLTMKQLLRRVFITQIHVHGKVLFNCIQRCTARVFKKRGGAKRVPHLNSSKSHQFDNSSIIVRVEARGTHIYFFIDVRRE